MKIEFVPIVDLKPDPRNSRKHSAAQIEIVKASIREYGWTVPILADDHVRAGHGRLIAAQEIYFGGETIRLPNGTQIPQGTVPVIDCTGWTEEQRRAYMIADNQIPMLAEWDDGILAAEIRALQGSFDLALTGFSLPDIRKLLATAPGAPDPEETPDPPVDPVSKLGDVWQLGDHRVICGDSTDPETVATLLDGATPHLMVSDPPYGVDYDPDWRNKAERADGTAYGASAVGQVLNDGQADWREAWALFPGDVAYVWHADKFASAVQASLEASKFVIRAQIIWAKDRMIISRGDYHWQHEPAWYAVRKGRKGHWNGGRKQTTLWTIEHRSSETGHGTQKPIDCMKRPIENNSVDGDAVYDPFLGSGTTCIAAEMTARRCYGVELSPAYVDVTVERWQQYTGEKAVRVPSGETFDAAKAAKQSIPDQSE